MTSTRGGPPALGVVAEFWLLAHERDRTLLHPKTVGVGLAGVLLAAAILGDHLRIDGMVLTVGARAAMVPAPRIGGQGTQPTSVGPARPGWVGGDGPLVRWACGWVAAETPPYPAGTWVRVLGPELTGRVVAYLVNRGVLHPGGVWRRPRLAGGAVNTAGWPAARLTQRLETHQPLTAPDVVLLAVAQATGLTGPLLRYATPSAHNHLTAAVTDLRDRHPGVGVLVQEVHHAVQTTALTRT
ncbi:MAG: GPP34 family phosphoprotein [Actinobacteria bacterium]|nr:GPP34 family phosphoprotein [Actinomycetota bacterium]MBI3686221.1 GPP34 family phosphoprotein [Actinomycetota bacterium]